MVRGDVKELNCRATELKWIPFSLPDSMCCLENDRFWFYSALFLYLPFIISYIHIYLNVTVSPDCLVTFIKVDSCKYRNPGSAFILGLFHFLHLVFALETSYRDLSSLFFPHPSAEIVMYVSVAPQLMYFKLFLIQLISIGPGYVICMPPRLNQSLR